MKCPHCGKDIEPTEKMHLIDPLSRRLRSICHPRIRHHLTGDRRLVTCQRCRRMQAFKEMTR